MKRTEWLKFRNHRCFKDNWAGFEKVQPVNVIIGRNNTGKSLLLDLVESACGNTRGKEFTVSCRGALDEASLLRHFSKSTSGYIGPGSLGGNHWDCHGKLIVGAEVEWQIKGNEVETVRFLDGRDFITGGGDSQLARLDALKRIVKESAYPYQGRTFRRLLADRDIRPEPPEPNLALSRTGAGATNIIRRFILSSRLERDLIQVVLLEGLNQIFGSDGSFSEIQVKEHDHVEPDSDVVAGTYEVFLGEDRKGGLISLSRSGSGLKTVLLVLLNLLVIPKIEKQPIDHYIFALEELENNLHPALLRRLFRYIHEYALKNEALMFLTTHSNVALDIFGASGHAQIVAVTHDGVSASCSGVATYLDQVGVISELGAKPSDLLQANGVVWVEGPSDCVYIERWINLMSNGVLRQGREYQCAFYGGALLARTQFVPPEEATECLVNLLRINANVILVCDGDRDKDEKDPKPRVERIRGEVLKLPGAYIWVTSAREIENYVPGSVISAVVGSPSLPDPAQFQAFFPRTDGGTKSYWEKTVKRKSYDKMEFALQATPLMSRPEMAGRFDWETAMRSIVERITSWNR